MTALAHCLVFIYGGILMVPGGVSTLLTTIYTHVLRTTRLSYTLYLYLLRYSLTTRIDRSGFD